MGCSLCPRECGAERSKGQTGLCGAGKDILIGKVTRFYFEEPPISGDNNSGGSGMIFFSGCSLRCVYCQNKTISHSLNGNAVTRERLKDIMLTLQDEGALNINLVTPSHYSEDIAAVLSEIKPLLRIPIVYNCSGYEKVETLQMLNGLIDIYLPDFKYYSKEAAKKYSDAENYFDVALPAIKEMVSQVGAPFLENGIMKKGVLVRHLVLPSHRKDSEEILKALAKEIGTDKILISLMRQYTPSFASDSFPELKRKVTEFEYRSVVDLSLSLGFFGFSQDKSSSSEEFTPNFDFKG